MSSWIRMRTNLTTSPGFRRVARAIRREGESREDATLRAVGVCYVLWSIGHSHADAEGRLPGGTDWLVDVLADHGVEVHLGALVEAGYLAVSEGRAVLPEWDVHNGGLHRKRAQTAERTRRWRARIAAEDAIIDNVTRHSDTGDAPVTRREERRGEEKREEREEHAAHVPPAIARRAEQSPPGMAFDWAAGRTVGITAADRDRWRAAYPLLDLDREIAKHDAWVVANPARTRRRKAWARSIAGWLARAEESARSRRGPVAAESDEDRRARIQREFAAAMGGAA